MKKVTIILILITAFSFSEEIELPGLGVYIGGVMGNVAGDDVDALDPAMSLSGPMLGVSYLTMAGPLPVFLGGGLGARSYTYEDTDSGDDWCTSFRYLDLWATMPYPISDDLSIYGGVLLGMPLSGSIKKGDADAVDLADTEIPDGPEFSLVFGLGYTLPFCNNALGVNFGYALGITELEAEVNGMNNDGVKNWTQNGLFFTLNYDVPGM